MKVRVSVVYEVWDVKDIKEAIDKVGHALIKADPLPKDVMFYQIAKAVEVEQDNRERM